MATYWSTTQLGDSAFYLHLPRLGTPSRPTPSCPGPALCKRNLLALLSLGGKAVRR